MTVSFPGFGQAPHRIHITRDVIASEAKQSHNPITKSNNGHCERSEAISNSRDRSKWRLLAMTVYFPRLGQAPRTNQDSTGCHCERSEAISNSRDRSKWRLLAMTVYFPRLGQAPSTNQHSTGCHCERSEAISQSHWQTRLPTRLLPQPDGGSSQ